jgi:hypothetical protein
MPDNSHDARTLRAVHPDLVAQLARSIEAIPHGTARGTESMQSLQEFARTFTAAGPAAALALDPRHRDRLSDLLLEFNGGQLEFDRDVVDQTIKALRWTPTVLHVEVTQAIQYGPFHAADPTAPSVPRDTGTSPSNSAPLVANKRTVVRVCTEQSRAAEVNEFEMRGELEIVGRPGVFKPTKDWVAAGIAGSTNHRGVANRGDLFFQLPAEVCVGSVTFRARVWCIRSRWSEADGHQVLVEEHTGYNTTGEVNVDFRPTPPLELYVMLISYKVGALDLPSPSREDAQLMLEHMKRMLPTHEIKIPLMFNYLCENDLSQMVHWSELLRSLGNLHLAFGAHRKILGILPASVPTPANLGGQADGNKALAIFRELTIAHEIGHMFGLGHAPPGGTHLMDEPPLLYPQYSTYPRQAIGEYGIDTTSLQCFDCKEEDFMHYNGGAWISPFCWHHLWIAFQNPGAYSASMPALSIDFTVDGTNAVLDSSLVAETSFPANERPQHEYAKYRVALVDREGKELASQRPLRPACVDDARTFNVALPWSDEAACAKVYDGSRVIGTFQVSDQAPVIKLFDVHTDADSAQLRWECEHPQGECIYHAVRYSPDGGATWVPLMAPTKDLHSLDVPLAGLPAGDRCVFELSVAAGLRGARQASQVFARNKRPRRAHIRLPERASSRLKLGDLFLLKGTAVSPDFASVPRAELTWWLDGEQISTGNHAPRRYKPGVHRVRLCAPDGLGGTASDEVELHVASDGTIETSNVRPAREERS